MLNTFHDLVVGGHSGFLRTYKRLASELYWPGMKKDVQKYCEECVVCQRNKTVALSPAGLLIPLEIPQQVWNDISMDFVKGFEVVLVVVDRLSKYNHFIPLKHPYTAKTVAEVLYGRKPPSLISYGVGDTSNSSLAEQLSERDTVLAALRDPLLLAQQQMKQYADMKRRHVEYAIGDWVFLKIRPYRQLSLRKKRNEKLSLEFFGPYEIVERVGPVAYKLDLPATTSIHPVFHVSQLKKFVGDKAGVQPTIQFLNENYEWQAQPEEALKYQKNSNGGWEVLIRWKDLPEHEASWECYDEIQRLYPTFHLEDKVPLYHLRSLFGMVLRFLTCMPLSLFMCLVRDSFLIESTSGEFSDLSVESFSLRLRKRGQVRAFEFEIQVHWFSHCPLPLSGALRTSQELEVRIKFHSKESARGGEEAILTECERPQSFASSSLFIALGTWLDSCPRNEATRPKGNSVPVPASRNEGLESD
ncbi:putative polyprotein [Cucumis melo var. makuwa]|uniref:Putative polyprotein n=1 Tax=Cucumis melo var. makuwa TaxID=1194695 RepID=A0A5D3DVW7_CUCMM|nr:putative polyprotein [Cucumis melo var. makuwa]